MIKKIQYIYWVEASHYDGDHKHGIWRSPPFSTEEAAKEFADDIVPLMWWSAEPWYTDVVIPRIVKQEVLERPDQSVELMQLLWHYKEFGELHTKETDIAREYLTVIYT